MGTDEQVAIAQLMVKIKDTERKVRFICAEFDENKVKRDKGGKFAKKEGSGDSVAERTERLFPKQEKSKNSAVQLGKDITREIDKQSALGTIAGVKGAYIAANKALTTLKLDYELTKLANKDAEETHAEVQKILGSFNLSAKDAYNATRKKGINSLDDATAAIRELKSDAPAIAAIGVVTGAMVFVTPTVALSSALGVENRQLEQMFLRGVTLISLLSQQVQSNTEAQKTAATMERVIKTNTSDSTKRLKDLASKLKQGLKDATKPGKDLGDKLSNLVK